MISSNQSIDLGRAAAVKTLRPFPAAACRLMELINDERADFREVSRVLSVDAAFSSQVLQVANSALLGSRYEITSILQALSVVGVDRLRDIVVTVALKDYMGATDNALLHRCWRHNLATAVWCEILAEQCCVDRPMGYTAGILHDIGRIALLMLFPDEYAGSLNGVRASQQVRLAAERKRYDADHCQVGHHLAVSWNFPRVLGDVIAYHHDEVTPQTPRPRLLVQAACLAASMSGFQTAGPEWEWQASRIEALLPSGGSKPQPDYEFLMHEVERKINQTECSLL